MYVDALRLTSVGEQAILNSNEGGAYLRPRSFRCGSYSGSSPSVVPENLLGPEVTRGDIRYCEVLSKNSVRFVFDIGVSEVGRIGEILIQLEDNIPLGHVVLQEPIDVTPLFAIRISLLLHTKYDISSILDVQMSEHSTIPSIASVEDLPHTDEVHVNAVSVLNMHTNSDGSTTPGMAFKYGAGSYFWAFSEHDRIFSEQIGDKFVSENVFNSELPIADKESVIIQVVAGAGAGAVRIFTMDNGQLVNSGKPIPHINAESTIAIWQRITTGSAGASGMPWPENSDVPEDWMLVRGKGKQPQWTPPSKAAQAVQATIFHPPGKLTCRALQTTAKPGVLSYRLPVELHSSSMFLCNLSGTNQPRTAFSIRGQHLDLSESVPSPLNLDMRMFYVEPSQGHAITVKLVQVRGDGQTSEFDIPEEVESADYVIATIGRIWQPTSSYTVKPGKIAFTDAPKSGADIVMYCMMSEERAGWTTTLRHAGFTPVFAQSEFILPVTPVSKDHVIFTENGLIVNPDSYKIVDNILYTTTPMKAGRYLEATIVQNLMSVGSKDTAISGVITDVVAGPRGLEFHRQGEPTLVVPLPEISLRGGKGIRVEGEYPNYSIISKLAEEEATDPKRVFSQHHRLESSEEIVVTQAIEFKKGITVSSTADFHAELGPGFAVTSGSEHIEYVIGIRGATFQEADYARGVKGSASAGFTILNEGKSESLAFANASISSIGEYLRSNHPTGKIEIVAKMRVVGADVTAYSSRLGINLCVKVEPV